MRTFFHHWQRHRLLLRWKQEPGVHFAVSFNPVTLMALAAVIGLVGVWSGVTPA